MKTIVWTKWDTKMMDDGGKPRCIFCGEVSSVPRVGEYIVVKEGFCAEMVQSVTHDFVRGEIEITVATCDRDREYGEVVCF